MLYKTNDTTPDMRAELSQPARSLFKLERRGQAHGKLPKKQPGRVGKVSSFIMPGGYSFSFSISTGVGVIVGEGNAVSVAVDRAVLLGVGCGIVASEVPNGGTGVVRTVLGKLGVGTAATRV